MIKEILALTSCVASIGAGSITPSRNYQHTEDVGNTEVTYKYETNEVNTVDDLVVGNLYKIDLSNLPSSVSYNITECYDFYGHRYNNDFNCNFLYNTDDYSVLTISAGQFYLDIFINNSKVNSYGLGNYVSYFQYKGNFNSIFIDYVSISDFNVIESVDYTPPTTIIGVINDFTTQYLFKDIPYVNDMVFTIGGQQITLMTWLVMVFGLITAVGLFILLFIVFRWLFRMFAGCFKPYK